MGYLTSCPLPVSNTKSVLVFGRAGQVFVKIVKIVAVKLVPVVGHFLDLCGTKAEIGSQLCLEGQFLIHSGSVGIT